MNKYRQMKNRDSQIMAVCCTGYVVQALVVNYIPLLFLTLQSEFSISKEMLSALITLNFSVQLAADMATAPIADHIGYKNTLIFGHTLVVLGLICLALLPDAFSKPMWGLVISVSIMAAGGGIIEVMLGPIVEGSQMHNKGAAMSLLHSFYCWGYVFVVLISTALFSLLGTFNWRRITLLWIILPIINTAALLITPVNRTGATSHGWKLPRIDRKLFIFLLLIFCAGASEHALSQWLSAIAEAELLLPKAVGDLKGPLVFAALMGSGRLLYSFFEHRLNIRYAMPVSAIGCAIGYLLTALAPTPLALTGFGLSGLSVSIIWPCTCTLAAERRAEEKTQLFALLAIAGDIGCAFGPTLVGTASSSLGLPLRNALLLAVAFPICAAFLSAVAAKGKK